MEARFSSPREEALEIALHTRRDLLQGKLDTISILRTCLVIATNLNKNDDKEWISLELSGYSDSDKFPSYRIISCQIKYTKPIEFYWYKVPYDVHLLSVLVKEEKDSSTTIKDKEIFLDTIDMNILLDKIIDRCLSFLNEIISELQYGGVVEYLMEEIRRNTDEKLANLDKKLVDETQSLYLNLTSTNPADWSKVGHSCRKILKLLADKEFPPREEQYKMKDGRTIEVGDPQYINRLCAFLDQKTSSEERKFLMAEIGYLEPYLRQVVEYDQMGEHKPSIEKFHADIMAIHTYLITSEILKHVP